MLQENQEVTIKATFNPYKAGEFTQFADLFLDGNLKKSHMRIKLKGEGFWDARTYLALFEKLSAVNELIVSNLESGMG